MLDDRGEPVINREVIRRTASIAALCELAEESAGGGELDELRERLVAIRLTESPDGIEEAEEAALALQHTIGAPPRLAEPDYLDRVGQAARRLEDALGSTGVSPFAEAMKAGSGTIEELAQDVLANYEPGSIEGIVRVVEGGFGFPLGGDPDELMRNLQEFAARQAESVAEAQREQFATLTLNTAVDLTGAALKRMDVEGGPDEQAIALRDAMRVLFPEAVALVSAARQGFMRET